MASSNRRRDKPFNIRMTEDEHQMLMAYAEHVGLSASDVVRQHIRQAYAETFGAKRPAKAGR
jgi:uncharacterized protein (DUF1778 family)